MCQVPQQQYQCLTFSEISPGNVVPPAPTINPFSPPGRSPLHFAVKFAAGFAYLVPTATPTTEEEKAIAAESSLMDPQVMLSLREEFIQDHNVMLALTTHGPM